MCSGKYRTSCYVNCETTIYVENLSPTEDVFYSFSESLSIYEYDEYGKNFNIATINEGEKITLEYNPSNLIIERYITKDKQIISDEDYDKITVNYINPKNWR